MKAGHQGGLGRAARLMHLRHRDMQVRHDSA